MKKRSGLTVTKKKEKPPQVWRILGIIVTALVFFRFMLPMLVFIPSSELVYNPSAIRLSFEDVTFTASDGVELHGWWIPAPEARATLLFFHGNAGNISHRLDSIKIFHDLRLSVFIFDYRGYGQSQGKPSIKGTDLDAIAAWRWLTEDKKIPPNKIVVFGRSLGGAVAVELMRSAMPGALILESTFSSLASMAPLAFILLPVARLVTWDAWDSAKTATEITVPTLCIHSPVDEIVPYRQGRRLFDAVAGEKMFVDINGSHNSGFLESYDIYFSALGKFLTKHFGE